MRSKKQHQRIGLWLAISVILGGFPQFAHSDKPLLGELSPPGVRPRFVLEPEAGYSTAAIAFSPDSKTIVTVSTGKGKYPETWVAQIEIWNTQTGLRLRKLKYDVEPQGNSPKSLSDPLLSSFSGPVQVAFSPDGKTIAVSTDSVSLWDAQTGKLLRTLKWSQIATGLIYEEYVTSLAFSPDSKELVVGITSGYNKIRIFDTQTGKQKWVLPVAKSTGGISTSVPIVVSPDGKMVASGGNSVRLWFINQ